MKFVVEVATKASGRLGSLSCLETGKSFQTPLLIQTTKAGSIPYLSREAFGYVTDELQVLQICLANCDHMDKALEVHKKGIASFIGYEDSPIFLTLKDPSEIAPSGFHEKDIVPLFTRRGKATITVDRYMTFVEKFKPSIYHALCDSDTNEESPKKRIAKSVERTEIFLKGCVERHKKSETLKNTLFLAPIVGGYSKEARSKCIKTVMQETITGGYLIDGFHNNGETALCLNIDKVKDVVSHCVQELAKDKLRVMTGAYTPLAVLELVQLDIDIFDTSYVYISAENYWALTFNFDIQNKKNNIPLYIDLSSERYKESFEPLLENCTCLACRKHTKAYVHHLTKTKELLGPILLMIHNTHHYLKYFETIRKSIAEGTLQELLDLLKEQSSLSTDSNKMKCNEEKFSGKNDI